MTEIETEEEEQSYAIPEDSLDSTHLGKYFRTPRAENIPLWSKKRMDGDSEYCQVQIGSQEETIEATTCHICSVEVPVICYKEHMESEQHVTLENIFQIVLERLSKQMKTTVLNNDSGINKDTEYFCSPCSKIIKVEYKQTHETSPYHVHSQKKLSTVKEFYKIFKKESVADSGDVQEKREEVGNEDIVDVESFLSGSNMDIESIHFNNILYDVRDGTNQDKFDEDCINTAGSSNKQTTIPSSDENLESSPVEKDVFDEMIKYHGYELYDVILDFRRKDEDESFPSGNNITENIQNKDVNNGVSDVTNQDESNDSINAGCSSNKPTAESSSDENLVSSSFEEYYFKEMARKYNLDVVLPIVDGAFVRVSNPSGITVKVLRENFHSFEFLYNKVILYCQMCKKWFNTKYKSKHKISERHAKHIFVPVSDQFARVFCYNSSHCLVCNKVVLTSLWQHHLDSEHHVRTLNSSVLADICQNSGETNVGTENAIEQTRSEYVQVSEDHKMVEDVIDSEDDEEQAESAGLTKEEHVDKSEEKNSKDSNDMSEDELDDYISDENHIETTKEVSSVQKLVFCKPCNVSVVQDRMVHHSAGTKHRNNAIKKILTVVAEGLEAFFSEDKPKPSGSSEKLKDGTKNESANSQEKPTTDENTGDHGEVNRNDHANDNESLSKDDNKVNHANKDESTNNSDDAINHANSQEKPTTDENTGDHGEVNRNDHANDNESVSKDDNAVSHANKDESTNNSDDAINHDNSASTSASNSDVTPPDPFMFAL